MSYDLAVWKGAPPATAAEAAAEFERRMDAVEVALAGGKQPAPAPAIKKFVAAALARYPELDADSGDECPWATSPLIGEAVGDIIYFAMTYSGAVYARDELAAIADGLGLVCFDPQVERVLPDPTVTSAAQIKAKADAVLSSIIAKTQAPPPKKGWFARLRGR